MSAVPTRIVHGGWYGEAAGQGAPRGRRRCQGPAPCGGPIIRGVVLILILRVRLRCHCFACSIWVCARSALCRHAVSNTSSHTAQAVEKLWCRHPALKLQGGDGASCNPPCQITIIQVMRGPCHNKCVHLPQGAWQSAALASWPCTAQLFGAGRRLPSHSSAPCLL